MYNFFKKEIKNKETFKESFEIEKYKNQAYLLELERLLDRLDNIEDEELKIELIGKIHRIENILCNISIKILEENIKK